LGHGVVLLYRVHAMTDAVLLEELKKLARARGAVRRSVRRDAAAAARLRPMSGGWCPTRW